MQPGIEDVVFCFLRFPSGLAAHLHLSWLDPHKERRFTVVGSKRMATFDDMDLERKVTVYDKGFDEDAGSYGEYITRSGDIWSPRDRQPRAAADRVRALRRVRPRGRARRARTATAGLRVVRVLEALQARARRVADGSSVQPSEPRRRGADRSASGVELAPTDVRSSARTSSIHPGTVIGDGCVIQDRVVLGKPPKLARALERAARTAPPPLVLGAGRGRVRGRDRVRRRAHRRGRDRRRPGLRARARACSAPAASSGAGRAVDNDVHDRRARADPDRRLPHRRHA